MPPTYLERYKAPQDGRGKSLRNAGAY